MATSKVGSINSALGYSEKEETDKRGGFVLYNEEDVLPELLARLTQVFDQERGYAWSAILVNDGSSDRSAELALAANARDSRFKLIELSRNFGFQGALAAGRGLVERG